VKREVIIFWIVVPCNVAGSQRFGGRATWRNNSKNHNFSLDRRDNLKSRMAHTEFIKTHSLTHFHHKIRNTFTHFLHSYIQQIRRAVTRQTCTGGGGGPVRVSAEALRALVGLPGEFRDRSFSQAKSASSPNVFHIVLHIHHLPSSYAT
jgi:hypothetical protein